MIGKGASRFTGAIALVVAVALPFLVSKVSEPSSGSIGPAVWPERGVHEASETMTLDVPDDPRLLPVYPNDLDQADINRPVSESFENAQVFAPGQKWRTFDTYVSAPGFNDEIRWGRRNCKATVGSWSVWSAGGGRIGDALACGATYPAPIQGRTTGIRTELQFLYVDMLAVPPEGGLRITFDYQSKMPKDALFIGAGDFDSRNAQGQVVVTGSRTFVQDTVGDWIRGDVVEVRNGPSFVITSKLHVLVAFVYGDAPPDGQGTTTSGMEGVTIDNVHLDTMFIRNPGRIPSPSATSGPPTPTWTPRPSPTNTQAGIVIPTTTTPGRPVVRHLPQALKHYDLRGQYHTHPTAPTPSITPTRRPTPTKTPTLTVTPTVTDTEEPTPRPSHTPIPVPRVVICLVLPLGDVEIVRVCNQGTAPQAMRGWRVFEKLRTNNCYFPDDLVLGPGEMYEFRSGREATPEPPNVGVCESKLIWDNNLDEAWLYNQNNDRVFRWCYDRNGAIPCPDVTPMR